VYKGLGVYMSETCSDYLTLECKLWKSENSSKLTKGCIEPALNWPL